METPSMSAMGERVLILWYFVLGRWLRRFRTRRRLLEWQQRALNAYLRKAVRECPYYEGMAPCLQDLPRMDKQKYRANFAGLNPLGISLDETEQAALQAERERDFSPVLRNGITVGLSSGTSGKRGVFLVSPHDRVRWAGIILARTLSGASLRHLLSPWRPALKIAFFLRADSNLYQTIANRRVDFRYFDLLRNFGQLVGELQEYHPDILIAPATVLAELAKKEALSIRPRQVISVAEVLEQPDAMAIEAKFGVRPANVYQATEGFIASTCNEGKLHLNEEFMVVEREWLDRSETRFHPVITDLSRTTQAFIRYRLDDVLVAEEEGCKCGRVSSTILRIEGRSDEILWFGGAVFPDVLRQVLYALPVAMDLYRLEQHADSLHVLLRNSSPELESQVAGALQQFFVRFGSQPAEIRFLPWTDQPVGEKQRRIRLITRDSIPR